VIDRSPIAPIMIGPANVEAATGLRWREALALARRLGVRVATLGDRRLIPAISLLDALDREHSPAVTGTDPEVDVLRRLGRGAR
jgi:hypothetical protein